MNANPGLEAASALPVIRCAHSKLVDVDLLVPNPRNPNKHPEEQIELLAKIMRHQGIRAPIVVSKRSGFMTKGHGRLMAILSNKWKQAPVDYQDYESEADEYADMVADNKIAELAQSDMAMINQDAQDLLKQFPNLDLDLFGIPDFTPVAPETLNPQCDEDDVPEKADPRSKTGDIWALGRHRLVCGDATNIADVEKLMAGFKADMIVTDPPYNVDYEGKTKESLTIENDSMSDESFHKFLYDSYTSMFMHTKPGGAIYVAHADSEGANFRLALKASGFLLKQCLVWVKQTLVMGRQDYHWKHEPILYGWAPGAAHNWYSDRKQTTVLEFNKPQRNGEHPTMKPVALFQYMIENSSKAGDLVMDLFGGSGTTIIACENTGRAARVLELDPKYCDVILARWEKYTGKSAELLNG